MHGLEASTDQTGPVAHFSPGECDAPLLNVRALACLLSSSDEGADDGRERVRAAHDAGAVLAVVLGDDPYPSAHAVSRLPTAEMAVILLRLLLLRSGAMNSF